MEKKKNIEKKLKRKSIENSKKLLFEGKKHSGKKSLCFAITKTKHQKKRKKNTSLQKTENLSPLKKNPLDRKTDPSFGKSNFFLKQQTIFLEETTLIKNWEKLFEKKN